ncbi:MAG: ABC transporter substrate-binding protein [Acidimicrobiia bacterium]|nr:ABC transporter substrate-binding protein [Acidimicrobiia bacterium]
MTRNRVHVPRSLAILLALALVLTACGGRRDDSESTGGGGEGSTGTEGEGAGAVDASNCPETGTSGVEDGTIKFVSSFPQSGMTAAFSEISKGYKAYFQYLNEEEGGVEVAGESYQIEIEDLDDEYNPARTSTNIDELMGVEGDQAFGVFNVVGTANNIAIRDNLGDLCVPNVFAATGSPAWGNEEYPWTIGSTLAAYSLEGAVFADLLKQEQPDATVAMLVQEDDFGRAYEEGFRNAIEGSDIEIVQVESYPTGANEVSAQMTSLAATDADAFFNGATLLACPNALQRADAEGWDPITWVSGTCISKTLMGIAGESATDVYSMTNVMDPLNPQYDGEEAMQLYREKVEQYQPDADIDNGIVAYGWTQGVLLVEALRNSEELTRQSFMQSVRTLDGVEGGLLLPGTSVTTSAPDDTFMGEAVQLIQYGFNGSPDNSYFENVGELRDFEGETPDLTPSELINA